MLVTSKKMIDDAHKNGYAIGSFNTSDLEITKAIIKAAEKLNAPVMVETSEKAISYAGLEELSAIIKEAAKKSKVPVALHLDHGGSLETVNRCLENGYTSIMFDGSKLSFNENIILTKRAAEMAHKEDIPCEGELGAIKKAGEEKNYTDPSEVREYTEKTKVDFLAVSIGSAHGVSDDEKLNIDLLKKIKSKTNIPLVLHGASGVTESDIKEAIKNGISKVNIDTDIRHTYAKAIREISSSTPNDPRDMMKEVMAKIQNLVEEKIKIFGSEGKAGNNSKL
jgi:fructose-bisphosphate aldolase class II